MASFAYLFERFPSFTQTFCYREVVQMCRSGAAPEIYAIRRPDDVPDDCPREVTEAVRYLPEETPLRAEVKRAAAEGAVKGQAAKTLAEWGTRSDKMRINEAIWLGPVLQRRGVRHVHAHFAGIAARTAFWLKEFYGISFSFTGHANDIFCGPEFPVTLDDLVREASFAVTETDFSRDWLRNRYPGWSKKIHRVYNGIDLSPFSEANPKAGKPHLISVGRCIEKKGFADLIDACGLLRDRGFDFECSIIGGGPLEEELRARVSERGLEGIVTLTGPKPQEEVRDALARSSLFILACATETDGGMDNFPTVIVEAMASALPVVSTRLAGVPELVRDGATGLLVEERNRAALAEAMERLLSDPVKARRFGAEGKRLVSREFAVAVTAGELRKLLAGCRNVRMPPPRGEGGGVAGFCSWLSGAGEALVNRVRPRFL